MKNINVLDSSIYNRISAGEVVENPSSVVKELVENSIDSGATTISIAITGGGIDKIRISDNGNGIMYTELEKAFMPHATSKISSVSDLDSISTLGFRGEALASISAVSKVKLTSKPKEQQIGGLIEVQGGEIKKICEAGTPDGTYINVENLFYNTPARKKFLRKTNREEAAITDMVSRLILANPDIEFKYSIDGRDIYHSAGKGLNDAVFSVYKKEALENSFYHYVNLDEVEIFGYLGKFDYAKSNRSYQTLIVNGRIVTNAAISACINNAYSEYMMKHKFPFYILFIKFPYEKIDVNVHPRKAEIKFDDNALIYNLVNNFIRECFKVNSFQNSSVKVTEDELNKNIKNIETAKIANSVSLSMTQADGFDIANQTVDLKNIMSNTEFAVSDSKTNAKTDSPVEKRNNIDTLSDIDVYKSIFGDESIKNAFNQEIIEATASNQQSILESPSISFDYQTEDLKDKQTKISVFDKLEKQSRIIGQVFNTYILIECEEKLLIMDQHAGHERIMYDKLVDQFEKNSVNIQPLLLPYIFETNSLETDFIKENSEVFSQIGFTIVEFGNGCFKLETVPAILSDINLNEFISSVLSDIRALNKQSVSKIFKDKLMQNACKSAIKAGQILSDFEIKLLLKSFDADTTLLCPHGRPIIVEIEKKSIEKWFKRII